MESRKNLRGSAVKTVIRTTVVLPKVLDQNIELLCMIEGKPKGELIATALKQFLEQKGMQPDKPPNINVIY
jgi:hypothetical protein